MNLIASCLRRYAATAIAAVLVVVVCFLLPPMAAPVVPPRQSESGPANSAGSRDGQLILRMYDVRYLIAESKQTTEFFNHAAPLQSPVAPPDTSVEDAVANIFGQFNIEESPTLIAGRLALRATATEHHRAAALLAAMRVSMRAGG